ncbi:MAG: phosphoglycolate phosphatase [Halobacteriales archaeon]|nr:phosphoglycolate phosphatase [Halobacteriales archaeon]
MRLAVDIDGTLTRGDGSGALDPCVFEPLRQAETVVVCTGKVLPNATALCTYVGVEANAVAETGGIVYADNEMRVLGDAEGLTEFVEEYAPDGDLGWQGTDLVNRWRETEVAVPLERDRDEIDEVAERHGLEVLDTGYAYHVKSPDVDKGQGLVAVAETLGLEPSEFVAVGDSENDVHTFEVAGTSYAVGNADDAAREAADHVTETSYARGFVEAVEREKKNENG